MKTLKIRVLGLTELADNNSDIRNKYIGVSVGYEFQLIISSKKTILIIY